MLKHYFVIYSKGNGYFNGTYIYSKYRTIKQVITVIEKLQDKNYLDYNFEIVEVE